MPPDPRICAASLVTQNAINASMPVLPPGVTRVHSAGGANIFAKSPSCLKTSG
jgi:hypothetical protein